MPTYALWNARLAERIKVHTEASPRTLLQSSQGLHYLNPSCIVLAQVSSRLFCLHGLCLKDLANKRVAPHS